MYAVTSTGIYCRPSCPARKPRRDRVRFFALPELARRAGYRACKRCRPGAAPEHPSLSVARNLCRYLEEHAGQKVTLSKLAAQVKLSPSQVQRSFKRVVGLTPQGYLEACRTKTLKSALQEGADIAGAQYAAGYSSSQLYSRADATLGMTPKIYQRKGEATVIHYALAQSPLGDLLVAATSRGICSVRLGERNALTAELKEEFARAELKEDADELRAWTESIVRHLEGREPHLNLPTDVRATAFQQQVWGALQQIPYGETRSYAQVAQALGKPKAVRAVARACASNPVALVVPCHRVVRSDGGLSGYRWGVERKRTLLEQEATFLFGTPAESAE